MRARRPLSRRRTRSLGARASARLSALLLTALFAAAGAAQAARLGPLNVASAFGQPLRAVVEIVDVGADGRPLAAEVASPRIYADLGVAYPRSLEGATVRLVEQPDGRWTVSVATARAVDEPDFNLVLVLTTEAGRQLRRYALAPEPPPPTAAASPAPAPPAVAVAPPVPAAAPTAAAPTSSAPAAEAAPAAPPVVAAAAPVSEPPRVRTPPQPAGTAAAASAPRAPAAPASERRASAGTTGAAPAGAPSSGPVTVRRGDTATTVARRVKPADVSDEQAVIALYQANEPAFAGSVHRLPEGAVLTVPEAARMREWTPERARAALRAPPHGAAVLASADGRGGDRLRIEPGGTGRGTSAHAGRGAGDAPDGIARAAALSELRSRQRDLESNVAELRRLLALRDAQIDAARRELDALAAGARGGPAAEPARATQPLGAASATLVRAPAAPQGPVAAAPAAPPPTAAWPIDPLAAAGVVAALALVAGLLWRRRRTSTAGLDA